MHKTHLALLAAAAVFAVSGMNGCYTMLVHPEVQTTDDATGVERTIEVTHAERCTDCHTGNAPAHGDAVRENYSGAYDGWSDYDPFWGHENYYNPFWSSPLSTSYFYDNYYSYRNLPWWVYPVEPTGSGYSDPDQANSSETREKPARRRADDSRRYSTPAPSISGTSSGDSGAGKPSASPSQGNSGGDSEKEKPARRGGIR